MRSSVSKLTIAAATAAFLLGSALPAVAQTAAPAPDATTQAAPDAQPPTKAEQKKAARAQRKAVRKAARAKKNAELKKLEDAGYRPATNDPNYPESIQNAQKKLNAPAGASQ